jgi:excinuclease ABC subunit B
MKFSLHSKFDPSGDQPNAIKMLTNGIKANLAHQTLLGATATGKTFTMANIINNVQLPTLVLAHNKTLAAQLFSEFSDFFPENAVRYFISYYDYYQPEAYVPQRDLYIEKEVEINKDIERYRAASTQALLTRKDVIIVASVSSIYGLGNPDDFMELTREFVVNEKYKRDNILHQLTDLLYERSEYDFVPGNYRVRGDIIDIYTSGIDNAIRLNFFGDVLESIIVINPITAETIDKPDSVLVFPAKQYVTPAEKLQKSIPLILDELKKQIAFFKNAGKELEAKRLEQRVNYDIEMLQEVGFVSGVENYSRIIEGRSPGSSPSTLFSYFPDDWLLFVDESHITLPQVRGMFAGDQARKQNLVDYGFRLPSAMDNRPLKFEEFNEKLSKCIYFSATPNEYELNLSIESRKKYTGDLLPDEYSGVVEQIIRPTGLVDPIIDIRKSENQIADLILEIKKVIIKGQRVMVTTLTKRMAEELTTYLKEKEIKVTYVHSDVESIERVEILRDLRLGVYDVIIGINLLREGLDIPEVSLVAILDADKEGFLRSKTSLIQTIGRAARHIDGKVIMYADKMTDSMKFAIDETNRRREIQLKYNKDNNITPVTISKEIKMNASLTREDQVEERNVEYEYILKHSESFGAMSAKEKRAYKKDLELQMQIFADEMEFEKAANIRDILKKLV